MTVLLRPDSEVADRITCILSDVDGVMTDGRIIYDNAGMETKRFHVHDGVGVKAWIKSGFQFGILTSRTSKIVQHRAAELGIDQVRQGHQQKLAGAQEMIAQWGSTPQQVCYIGDDLPDIAVMKSVGLAVAPADAATDARNAAHWILRRRGGEGVLRELIERLLRAKHRWEEHLRY